MAEIPSAVHLKLKVSEDTCKDITLYHITEVENKFQQELKAGALLLGFWRYFDKSRELFYALAYPEERYGATDGAWMDWDMKVHLGSPLYLKVPDKSSKKYKLYRVLEN